MALHDRFLDLLLKVADVSLVALWRGESVRLGANNLEVFLGDVHLVSDKCQREGEFEYQINHEGLLVELLEELAGLQEAVAGEGASLNVCQVGDYLDPWREVSGFDVSEDAAARIEDDHQALGRALRVLGTTFIFGNHDLELYPWPEYRGWERRWFLPGDAAPGPRIFVTHGDVFDSVERFPDRLKHLLVYYLSPKEQVPTFELGVVKDLTIRSHGDRTYRASIGVCSEAGKLLPLGGESLPAEYNVQREGAAPAAGLQYLVQAREICAGANAEHGYRLGAAVIGHTHHPRIAVSAKGSPPFVLVDCGAWIERNLSAKQPVLNAQITAISGDEVRIYQLAPKAKPGAVATVKEELAREPRRKAKAAGKPRPKAAAKAKPSRKVKGAGRTKPAAGAKPAVKAKPSHKGKATAVTGRKPSRKGKAAAGRKPAAGAKPAVKAKPARRRQRQK